MKKCGFKFETQESRAYEYGRGKEFVTREEALNFAKKRENEAKTQISLAGCSRLYDSSEIIEEGNSFKIVIKMKHLIINF